MVCKIGVLMLISVVIFVVVIHSAPLRNWQFKATTLLMLNVISCQAIINTIFKPNFKLNYRTSIFVLHQELLFN